MLLRPRDADSLLRDASTCSVVTLMCVITGYRNQNLSILQIRNYSDCACVQSRQVITPSSSGQGTNQLQLVIVKTYLNENGYAVSGKCDRTCSTLIPFLIFLFIVTLITACAQPSAIIVTLRYGLVNYSWCYSNNSLVKS